MEIEVISRVDRPWGFYSVLYSDDNYWTKFIEVLPGESLSLQYHGSRVEYWIPMTPGLSGTINGLTVDLEPGVRYRVGENVLHRITNKNLRSAMLIEVATGSPKEDDIVRINDKYGRA